ncbi:Patatin [Rhodopseudomonas palustris BisB18]|uniref:Patatin n=2 Tax=Rhodopseudomonas palustris TaxID=1076 RepID=Q212W4_RHOPB
MAGSGFSSTPLLRLAAVLVVALSCAGCASLNARNVVPERLADEAELAGMPNIRIWGDASAAPQMITLQHSPKARALSRARGAEGQQPRFNVLAISGGGEDGAFGAGLLVGWSDAGTRPDFDVVTGVSAGALAAPFAYLGPSRDSDLKEVFTRYTRSEIYDPGILPLLGGSGLVDSSPLQGLIASYVDDRFLRDIATERRRGRILLIGTTNLDAQRPVLWDMGRIAMSGHPHALSLFRKILLASASIPGVFPPVHIKVSAEGRNYEELHVDGGVTQQVFVPSLPMAADDLEVPARRSARRMFIIRNGKVSPEWETIEAGVFSISRRSVSTLIKNQGIGDIYRIYAKAQADGIDFNLAAIPSDLGVKWTKSFDLSYMRALYDEGYRSGVQGYRWIKTPPGLATAARPAVPPVAKPQGVAMSTAERR